jgi:hypothetical protein
MQKAKKCSKKCIVHESQEITKVLVPVKIFQFQDIWDFGTEIFLRELTLSN